MIKGQLVEIPVSQRIFARYQLERLILHFGLEVKLKWSHGRRRGIYLPGPNEISIGPNAWNGVTDTLLHQYAHAIAYHNHMFVRSHDHGLQFCEWLWKIVQFYYKSPDQYQWYGDYREVFEFGKNRCRIWLADKEDTC